MDNVPSPPDGYKHPEKYELPRWVIAVAAVGLVIIFVAVIMILQVQYRHPNSLLTSIMAAVFAFSGSLYLHESAHYIVADYFSLDPEFTWPNQVHFGADILPTNATVASLLAPQLLSLLYIIAISVGVAPIVEWTIVVALAMNFLPGAWDVSWAIRRLTWPKGTIVMLRDGDSHVSFPEE